MDYMNQHLAELPAKIQKASEHMDLAIAELSEIREYYACSFPEEMISNMAGQMADMIFEVNYTRHTLKRAVAKAIAMYQEIN